MPGLDPLFNAFNDPKNIVIACLGDSTTYGTSTTNFLGWPGALRSLANARWSTGSDGLHVCDDRNFSLSPGFWSISSQSAYNGTDWKQARTTDAWDRSLGSASGFCKQGTYLGSTSSMVATWTKPSYLTVDEFYLWVVDGASSGNFSYSIDGGTSWSNVSQTWAQDNTIKRIRIHSSITGTNTVKIRGANAAGTAVNCYLIGLEPAASSSTFTIHNFGVAGQTTGAYVRTTSGNWYQTFDQYQPQLVIFMMTNDAALTEFLGGTSTASWRPVIEAIADVVTGYGGAMLFMNFFEQNGRSISLQADYRAMIKSIAADYGMPCIDFYDLVGDGPAAVAAGYVNSGDIHPNDAGAAFIAQQAWKVIGRPYQGARFRT